MKRRHKAVLGALRALGGEATPVRIADHVGFDVNSVIQILPMLKNVKRKNEEPSNTPWVLVKELPRQQSA